MKCFFKFDVLTVVEMISVLEASEELAELPTHQPNDSSTIIPAVSCVENFFLYVKQLEVVAVCDSSSPQVIVLSLRTFRRAIKANLLGRKKFQALLNSGFASQP